MEQSLNILIEKIRLQLDVSVLTMKIIILNVAVLLLVALAAVNAGGCPYSASKGRLTKTVVESYKRSKDCPITAAQRSTLLLALKDANKDGLLGAKVLLKYILAHPEARKLFPSLDFTNPADVLQNTTFVGKSAVCFSEVTHLISSHYFDKSRGCPYTERTMGHYTTAQQLGFGKALLDTVMDDLGDRMTPEIQNALKIAVSAFRSAAGVCPIDLQHRQSIAATLKAANQDGSLGVKTFNNFFKFSPEHQKAFEANGSDLNVKSSSCLSALSMYFNPKVFGTTSVCPLTANTKRYSYRDQKKFCVALLAAVKESGLEFDPEAIKAFRIAYAAIATHKRN